MTKILACLVLLLFGLSACDTGWKARVAQSGKSATSISQYMSGRNPPDW